MGHKGQSFLTSGPFLTDLLNRTATLNILFGVAVDVKQLSKTARFVPESLFLKRRRQSRDNEIHQLLSRTAFRIRVCFGPKRGSGFDGETGGEIPKARLRPIESFGGEPTHTDFFYFHTSI